MGGGDAGTASIPHCWGSWGPRCAHCACPPAGFQNFQWGRYRRRSRRCWVLVLPALIRPEERPERKVVAALLGCLLSVRVRSTASRSGGCFFRREGTTPGAGPVCSFHTRLGWTPGGPGYRVGGCPARLRGVLRPQCVVTGEGLWDERMEVQGSVGSHGRPPSFNTRGWGWGGCWRPRCAAGTVPSRACAGWRDLWERTEAGAAALRPGRAVLVSQAALWKSPESSENAFLSGQDRENPVDERLWPDRAFRRNRNPARGCCGRFSQAGRGAKDPQHFGISDRFSLSLWTWPEAAWLPAVPVPQGAQR